MPALLKTQPEKVVGLLVDRPWARALSRRIVWRTKKNQFKTISLMPGRSMTCFQSSLGDCTW